MDMDGREEGMQEERSQRTEEGLDEQTQPAQQIQRIQRAEEVEHAQDTMQAQQVPDYQPPPPEAPEKKGQREWLKPVAVGALIVAVGVGSFFGGMAVGDDDHPKQVAVGGTGQGGQAMPSQPDGSMGGEMPGRMGAMGEVAAINSSSITIEDMRSGEASTYEIDALTEVLDARDAAEVSDIQVGDNVMVVPSDSDESVAARIIINPAMGGPGGQGGQGNTPPGGNSSDQSSDSSNTSSST